MVIQSDSAGAGGTVVPCLCACRSVGIVLIVRDWKGRTNVDNL
ncbi:hypothetical protein [Rubritalea tangerina]